MMYPVFAAGYMAFFAFISEQSVFQYQYRVESYSVFAKLL